MKRALVSGGAGFIGSHLVRRLLAEGVAVRVLDNFSTGYRRNLEEVAGRIELIEGSITDDATLAEACDKVDVVFHLAASVSVPRSVEHPFDAHDANATGTLRLLLAARKAGVTRLVNSASSAAYGDSEALPKVESMTPAPLSPYAVAKLASELYCRNFTDLYGLQTVSLRYFNVFGPRQDPDSPYAAAIPAFVSRILAGEQPVVFGDGEQTRDFCFIENVIHANLLAARAETLGGAVLNIACGERVSINAIIAKINELLGTQVGIDYRPPRAGDVKHSLADIGAAKRLIGYEPQVMFAEGLERSIAWYRENL